MTMRRISLFVFLVLCAMCIVHDLYYYPQLPDWVACRFGASGRPNDWSSKLSLIRVYLLVVILCAVTFLGVGYAMSRIPISWFRLPNKDYWLAPQRRQETVDSLFNNLLWFGSATLAFVFYYFHQIIRVNLGKTEALEHTWLIIGAYSIIMIAWSIVEVLKYDKIPQPMPPLDND